jgi:hypothetical protein
MTARPILSIVLTALLGWGCASFRDDGRASAERQLGAFRELTGELTRQNVEQATALGRLQRELLARDAEISRLQLANAQQQQSLWRTAQELERARERLRGLTGEAEAAAAIAETEAALDAFDPDRQGAADQDLLVQARALLEASEAAFARGDYAGAAALADHSWHTLAGPEEERRRNRGNGDAAGAAVAFPTPLKLRVRVDSHLRQGPGMKHGVAAVLQAGTPVVASGAVGNWARVAAPQGPEGWIYRALLQAPE